MSYSMVSADSGTTTSTVHQGLPARDDARSCSPKAHPSTSASNLKLKPYSHQVAGHLFEDGKAGSLTDELGRFYKPVQVGKGARERDFYEWQRRQAPAAVRGLQKYIPRYHGTLLIGDQPMLVLEDLCRGYKCPCVMDVKVGFRTWYSWAPEWYRRKARAKDESTTQATRGFKICGMQVLKARQGQLRRGSKSWCKRITSANVTDTLLDFADNELGLAPADIYGGKDGAIAQLVALQEQCQKSSGLHFYSSSVLVIYEGAARSPANVRVRVRLVDFAHTFHSRSTKDDNFISGLSALIETLRRLL